MNFQWAAVMKLASVGDAVLVLSVGLLLPTITLGNGLGENMPYRFEQRDRHRMLEMQQLKESGFYDSQSAIGGSGGAGGGDTIVHGDQINCIIQSSSLANSNASGFEAVTGSLSGVSDGDIGANANANQSDAYGRGDGELNVGQDNAGNQNANISDSTMNSNVGEFRGGGTSNQKVDSYQSADGSTLTSSINDATVCDGMTVN